MKGYSHQALARWRTTLLDSLHGNFVQSIFIRGAGALAALSANIVLARLLGVNEYGRYMSFYSVAIVLGSFAVRGSDQLLTRELSSSTAEQSYRRRELARWSLKRTTIGIAAAVMVYVIWRLLAHFLQISAGPLFGDVAALMLIGTYSGCTLIAGALNGFRASQRSQSLVPLVNNGVVLLVVGVLWIGFRESITDTAALWLQFLGYAFAAALGATWLRRLLRNSQNPKFIKATLMSNDRYSSSWASASNNFLMVTIAAVVVNRLDVVLVSMLVGNHIAGIYVAGARLAQLALLVAVSVNTVMSPRISKEWSTKNYRALRHLLNNGFIFTALVSAAEIILAVLYSKDIIGFFGSEYTESKYVFLLVVVAYSLWTLAAPVYALLNMTGSERTVSAISWLVVVSNFTAIMFLVPAYGAVGGGLAMITGYAIILPISIIAAFRKLKSLSAIQVTL